MEQKFIDLSFVRQKRIEKGFSIEQMAILLGYKTYQAYHRKERGERELSVSDLVKMANILDEPVQNFFKQEITILAIKEVAT